MDEEVRKYLPEMRHKIPLEDRKIYYNYVRARIFKTEEKPKYISKRIQKIREKYRKKRDLEKLLLNAMNRVEKSKDNRVYVNIEMEGKMISGLLDSGASVSILGKGCREITDELDLELIPIFSNVKTASGHQHRILGKVKVSIRYKDREDDLFMYLCPDLEQALYLGIDFWRKFELAPEVIGIDELNMDRIMEDFSGDSDSNKIRPHNLNPEQKERLNKVIRKFDTFEENGLGRTSLEKHVIKLVDGAEPIKDRHYPISPAIQEITYKEIDKMLELNVIEVSESPWSNRTTIVRKPGKNRFCLDARKLNKLTVKDAYPLQNIDGILSRIDETYFISSVDLKYAFWQIELEPESRAFTAFTVAGRPLYQFRVMPFGLCNAAQRLCRLMDKVIPPNLKDNVFIYLDDLLIISNDFDKHLQLLEQVANCLRKANLTIGLEKSQFCFQQLKYLGFILGEVC